jgi:hypothetical protein
MTVEHEVAARHGRDGLEQRILLAPAVAGMRALQARAMNNEVGIGRICQW